MKRILKFSTAKKRKFGRTVRPCRKCGKMKGVVHKYGICYCRQCFREEARKIGFDKYS